MNASRILILGFVVSTIIIYLFIVNRYKQNNKSKQEKNKNNHLYLTEKFDPSTTILDIWPTLYQKPSSKKDIRLTDNPPKRSQINSAIQKVRIGETYLIDYQNRNGEITQRTITIRKIYRDNTTNYINAYCHLRGEERTFKLDGIIGYITDIKTGEMLDPEELNPLKNKQIISPKTAKLAAHKEISFHNESWFLHHPNDNVSTIADRNKLKLTAYRYQIDAYRAAINKTIEEEKDTLCLFVYGKYKPSKKPDKADKITIIQIDTSTREGIAKKKLII